MATLVMFARYEMEVSLAALTAVVVYQIVTGRITTRGLLTEKTRNGVVGFSPARLQLLLVTLAAASYVLSQVASSIAHGPAKFPDIDVKWLLIFGGSHSIYLGSKSLSLFR